jgi:sensor histidine kinase YesM
MEFKIIAFNLNLAVTLFLLTLVGGQTYWLMEYQNVTFGIALSDSLISYLFMYGIFLFIRYSPSFYIPRYLKYGAIDFQGLILTIVWVYSCKYLLTEIVPSEHYLAVWNHTFFIRGLIGWILLCFFISIHLFASEFEKFKTFAEKEQVSEQLRKEAELFKLRQQLQPHFLFNSLNSINALIGKHPQEARLMVQQLSDYLRNNMKKEDNEQVSIREEIADLKLYLAIELVRFGHRLKIKENFEIPTPEQLMPPFLIQPLVENAIKFGLYGTIGEVCIEINASQKKDKLIFQISNPFDTGNVTPKGTGFGLASIRRRLYLLYSRNDLLKIRQFKTETGVDYFSVTIEIPLFSIKTNEPNQ